MLCSKKVQIVPGDSTAVPEKRNMSCAARGTRVHIYIENVHDTCVYDIFNLTSFDCVPEALDTLKEVELLYVLVVFLGCMGEHTSIRKKT